MLITSTEGNFLLLTPDEFTQFAEGAVEKGTPLYQRLAERNFVRAEVDTRKMSRAPARAEDVPARGAQPAHRRRHAALQRDVRLLPRVARRHDATHTDMTKEIAEQGASTSIFQSTNPSVTIEFQGGEPLVNFAVVKHVIEYAREKNKTAGKQLEFTMVSEPVPDGRGEARLPRRQQGPDLHEHRRARSTCTTSSASCRALSRAPEGDALDPAHQRRLRGDGARPDALPRRGAAHDDARDAAAVEGGRRHVRRPRLPRALPPPGRSVRLRRQDRPARRVPARRVPRVLPQRRRLHARAQQAGRARSSSASPPSSSRRSSAARIPTSSTSARRAARASARSPTTTTARSSPATRGGCSTRWATARS